MGTEKRFKPYFPDVPTFKELGINMTAGISRGVCVPPGTPKDRIAVLEKAFDKVCRGKNFVSKMEGMGFEVNNLGAKEFGEWLADKKIEYTDLLRKLKQIK